MLSILFKTLLENFLGPSWIKCNKRWETLKTQEVTQGNVQGLPFKNEVPVPEWAYEMEEPSKKTSKLYIDADTNE